MRFPRVRCILPVEYLIHIRQLTFLHHIVFLNDLDPVLEMFTQQQHLPFEKNWSNQIFRLLNMYKICYSDIKTASTETWKETVKDAVQKVAFNNLVQQAQNQSKTKHLKYDKLALQSYLVQYNHKQASTIFKIRTRSTECKQNRKDAFPNMLCRLCETDEETQAHVVNCPSVSQSNTPVDLNCVMGDIPINCPETVEVCLRFNEFSKLINRSSSAKSTTGNE